MMARAKRIYILMVKVNKFIFFFGLRYFLKDIENMFFVLILSYRNTRESLGELKKAVETLACHVPQHFSFSQTFTRVSIKQLDYELEISITHRNRERII